MRVNQRVLLERMDMMGDIKIPNCNPAELRGVAEKLMNLLTKPDYSVGDYNTMGELDKILIWDYWREFDGLKQITREWFIGQSTDPDLITRARRWLRSHNYIFIKPDVEQRAMEAEENMRRSIKQGA